ncbi:STN domain-containing protein, partial [Methylogaea oryzae]
MPKPLLPSLPPLLLATCAALPAASVRAEEVAAAYQIAAQPLDSALLLFGRQSGVRLLYGSDLAKGLKTSGLKGRYTPEEALGKLLADTPLQARRTGDGTWT